MKTISTIHSNHRVFHIILALALALILPGVRPAQAAAFDVPAGDSEALIAAILAANDETTHPGADTLILGGGVYTLIDPHPAGGEAGPTGLPSITSEITIEGHGAIIERDPGAEQLFRLIYVAPNGSLTLEGLTVRGGDLPEQIYPRGGGITNAGALTLRGVLVHANRQTGVFNSGWLSAINTTFSANRGGLGGALTNSVSDPQKNGAHLVNVTFHENTASFGGAIYGGFVTAVNTLFGHNPDDYLGASCSGGGIQSSGYNLEAGTSCRLYAAGDLPSVEPLLGPLADNGGPTLTYALQAYSPALNSASPTACPPTDGRGAPRPQGPSCDIGAYEAEAGLPAVQVDQANVFDTSTTGWWSLVHLAPIGQSFVPTAPYLIAVDVWTEDEQGNTTEYGTLLQAEIYDGSLTGPRVGVSEAAALPQGYHGATHFPFSQPLSLNPGSPYVIAIRLLEGRNWGVVVSQIYPDSYPQGSAYAYGEPSGEGIDLWFRTWTNAELAPTVLEVQIDIKPGGEPNSVNCRSRNSLIPVAVLTRAGFDAASIDAASVSFEGASEFHTGRSGKRLHLEDVDGDGDLDAIFHFRSGDTTLTCASTQGTLQGATLDDQAFAGTDSIRMVPK